VVAQISNGLGHLLLEVQMPVAKNPTKEERQRSAERAREWREFRKTYLYSQGNLAHALRCGRRTVCAIESAETIQPNWLLLRRFRALKQRHEKTAAAHAEITSRLPVYDMNLYERRA
jgi:DNA-binding XRE family transcriptional regulator